MKNRRIIIAITTLVVVFALAMTFVACARTTKSTATTATTKSTTTTEPERNVDGLIMIQSERAGTEKDDRKKIVKAMKSGENRVIMDGVEYHKVQDTVYAKLPVDDLVAVFDYNTLGEAYESFPIDYKGRECSVTTDGCYLEIFEEGEELLRLAMGGYGSIEYAGNKKVVLSMPNGEGEEKTVTIVDPEENIWIDIADDVIDVNAKFGRIWILTTDGEVYASVNRWWETNQKPEMKLMAENAIALSNAMSDGPGWVVSGELDPEWEWAHPGIVGKFVPAN